MTWWIWIGSASTTASLFRLLALDFNRGRQRGPYELQHFLDDQVDLDGLLFLFGLAAERKNLVDQTLGALAGGENVVQGVVGVLALAGMDAGNLRIAEDRLQDVVEVVGNPARQRSDRFHLLGLAELGTEFGFFFFRLDALGDIAGNGEHGRLIVVLDGTAAGLHRDDRAVLGLERRFEDDMTQAAEFIHAFRPEGGMLGGYDVHRRFVEHVVAGDAELFAGDPIAVDDLPLEVHHENGVAGAFKQGLVTVGGSHQRLDRTDVEGQASKLGVFVPIVAVFTHCQCFAQLPAMACGGSRGGISRRPLTAVA
jgi:hypothetical protein